MTSDSRIKKPIRITGQLPGIKTIDKISDVSSALNHALITLNNEIQKIRVKSFLNDVPLSAPEIKIITEAIKSLLAAEKQQMEAAKSDDLTKKLAEMSDEQLLEYAKLAITAKTQNSTLENIKENSNE